ncbi:MAG: response regulator [bacterium]|nr:response regulator [bacterium]
MVAVQNNTDKIGEGVMETGGMDLGAASYLVGFTPEWGLSLRSPMPESDPTDSPKRIARPQEPGSGAYLNHRIDTEQTRLWLTAQEADRTAVRDGAKAASVYPGPNGERVLGIHLNLEIAGTRWAVISEVQEKTILAPANELKILILSTLAFTALLVLAIATLVTRRIVRPIEQLSDAAGLIASGKLEQEIESARRDELGGLSRSFADMVSDLREGANIQDRQNWFKLGQTELSEKLRGDKHITELARDTVTYLAKYLNAQVGALYVASGQRQLQLVGSYAFQTRKNLANRFEYGQGLVGQAALEKQHILLTDAPDDSLTIRSGLGDSSPRNIIVWPFVRDSVVAGVVELGAFEPFEDRCIEFLKRTEESIAVSIEAMQSRIRLQELLEESQAQSEELQSQTQMLQASEESLQAQNEELQSSNEQLEEKTRSLELQKREIEAGKMKVNTERVELAEILVEAERRFKAGAERNGLALELEIEDGLPSHISTDAQRVGQVTKNLLSNALKFTKRGSIRLSIGRPEERGEWDRSSANGSSKIAISVTDTGSGIPDAQRGTIFDAFNQAGGTTGREYGGTGFGLSISLQIARLLGGKLHLESEEGVGGCFTLILPESIATSAEPSTSVDPARETSVILRPDAPTVLVIGENRILGETLREFAGQRGFECLFADTGGSGLEMARRQLPSAILLDAAESNLDEQVFLEHLHGDRATRDIPVHIIATERGGSGIPESEQVTILRGAFDPIQLGEVFERIEGQLDRPFRKLLLVDDDPSARSGIAALLGRELSRDELARLDHPATQIIHKDASAQQKLLDLTAMFLHRVNRQLPEEQQRKIESIHDEDTTFAGKTLLLVDDDMRNLFAISSTLEQYGAEIVMAANGLDAFESLEREPGIDLVLMDIMMPEMDGYEAMRRTRARENFNQLPIIAITAKATKEDRALLGLLETVLQTYNYDFRQYRSSSLKRQVQRTLNSSGLGSIEELRKEILANRPLFNTLLGALTINVTEMFRDPDYFRATRERLLPSLQDRSHLKFWHAGCATGEEVYSMAILLQETGLYDRSLLYATDIDAAALQEAREGIFPITRIRDSTSNYQQSGGTGVFSDYYLARYDAAIVNSALKKNIVFSHHSLANDDVFTEVDVVICRNVLIYFDPELQHRAIELFKDSLQPGGFLCLGSREALCFSSCRKDFDDFSKDQQIYRRRGDE